MKRLGLLKISFFLLILSFFGIKETKACHYAAADIYVTYVGAGVDGCGTPDYKYEVTLIVYYACQGCFLDGGADETVWFESEDAGFADEIEVFHRDPADPNNLNPRPDTSHSLCGEFKDSNSCISPNPSRPVQSRAENFPAFRVRTYKGNVTLPSGQTDWKFWWANGGRNASNLSNQGNIYVEAGLNNLTKYNNSTPRFLSNPLPYICINQPTTYLNGPWDPNGDSMYVYQQLPYTGGRSATPNPTPIAYQGAWSVNDPIGSTIANPYQLNPITGAATFTPTAQGFFVLAFRGEDYERGTGTRLSYIYRDVQVTVLPCTAPPPGIDSTKQIITSVKNATVVKTKSLGDMFFVCPGSAMEFGVSSLTDSLTHKVYVTANTDLLPGSTFTTTGQGTSRVDGVFRWTPTTNDVGDHSLVIISKDSTCTVWQPIVLTNYRVVLIRVLSGLDAGPDLSTCQLNPLPTPFFVRGYENLSIKWTMLDGGPATTLNNDTIHNPVAINSNEQSYIVSTPDLTGTCKSRDTIALFHNKENDIKITPKNPVNENDALVMCLPGYLQLEATPVGKGPKNNVACGTGNATNCATKEDATIFGSFVYGEKVYDTIGSTTPIFLNTLKSTRMQYLIRRQEMKDAKVFAATLRSMSFEAKGASNPNYQYTNFRILMKCTNKDNLVAGDGFENTGMTEVYYAPAISMPDGVQNFEFNTPYNWDTTKNIIIQMCYSDNPVVDTGCGVTTTPPRLGFVPTTYASGLILEAPDVTTGSVCGIDNSADIRLVSARPAITFSYCEADPLQFDIKWIYGNQLSDTTTAQALAYVPSSTYFVAETKGRSECIMRDTLNVYVPEHDIRIEPADTAICLGDKAPFTIYGGHFFKWYEYENGQYIDPVSVGDPKAGYTFLGPDKTTEYRIVVSDSVFCYDTIAANVKVLPLPNVRILNEDDTVIKYGQSFKILATGARYYNWSPVSSLNNPNISYPVARPTEDTKYIVGGIGANGCRAFDTLHVIVDKRDNLFVPSAFSPNGDGKNDLFKITNLSFQRIMEFRVFNRWGQEVYSTNDSRAGWDGTWGGVPQDMGTYTYLIRVAYPDGFVETYKGETTLIR